MSKQAVDKTTGELLMKGEEVYTEENLLIDWKFAKQQLDYYKALEMELRLKVVACASSPEKMSGTENLTVDEDTFLKIVKSQTMKLVSNEEGVSLYMAVHSALAQIASATQDSNGNILNPALGKKVAERLVNWKPELNNEEYKNLLPGHREIIDTVIEKKSGAPAVTLKETK